MLIGTVKAARLLGISCQRVRQLLKAGRITGAFKEGRFWRIPVTKGMPKVKAMNRGTKGTWRKRPSVAFWTIHIIKQNLDRNRKYKTNEPVIAVRQGNRVKYCHSVLIDGPSRLVYDPDNPLACGATLWIEAGADVNVRTEVFA